VLCGLPKNSHANMKEALVHQLGATGQHVRLCHFNQVWTYNFVISCILLSSQFSTLQLYAIVLL
jgi:hypothetical protein